MSRRAIAAAAASALCVAGPAAGAPVSDGRTATRNASVSPPAGRLGVEVSQLRTRNSSTYRAQDGSLVAKISASPLNFHDAGGEWQPIDNALVRSGSSLRNRANSYEVWLPSRLGSEPVRVQSGASELTFALRSAAGAPARAHGNVADYDAALPHVDVRYEAMADHVKETLLLASRAAPSRYAFDLSLGDGLRPMRQDDGSIAITDASGHLKMTIAAPFAVDASGATSTRRDTASAAPGAVGR